MKNFIKVLKIKKKNAKLLRLLTNMNAKRCADTRIVSMFKMKVGERKK